MPDSTATNRRSAAEAGSDTADSVGRVLGRRYRLVAPIGAGTSARVYLADDLSLGRRVAVKCLRSGLSDDARFLRRFRAEAKAAAQLSHPNLLAVYDWGEDESATYLVTEVLLGGSLLDLIERSPRLTPSQGLLVALQVAQGLNYAHDLGWIHRDIKPANLLFGEEGRLRIADFGIARAVAEAAWTEPEGILVGTARYAAPEQAESDAIDGKADVYSLALTIIEAVTGQVPLLGDSALATMVLRQDRDVDQLDELGPLAAALGPAGRADPAQRPTAAQLIEALTRTARSLPRPRRLPLATPLGALGRAGAETGDHQAEAVADRVIDLRDEPPAGEGDPTEVEGHQLLPDGQLGARTASTPNEEDPPDRRSILGGFRVGPARPGRETGVEGSEDERAVPDMTIIERPPPTGRPVAPDDVEPLGEAPPAPEPPPTGRPVAPDDVEPPDAGPPPPAVPEDTAASADAPGRELGDDAVEPPEGDKSDDPASWPPPPFPTAERRPAHDRSGRNRTELHSQPQRTGSWLDQSKIVPATPPPGPSSLQAQASPGADGSPAGSGGSISELFNGPADPVDGPSPLTAPGAPSAEAHRRRVDAPPTADVDPNQLTHSARRRPTGPRRRLFGRRRRAVGQPRPVRITRVIDALTHEGQAPPARPTMPVRRTVDLPPATPTTRSNHLAPGHPAPGHPAPGSSSSAPTEATAHALPGGHEPADSTLVPSTSGAVGAGPGEGDRPHWLPLLTLSVLIAAVLAIVFVIAVRTDDDLATSGPPVPPPALVGDYVGQPLSVAEAAADRNNWLLSTTQGRQRGTSVGEIIDQEPAPGEPLLDGDRLSIVVSLGPELTTVPAAVGLPLDEAAAVLRGAGLELGVVIEREDDAPKGQVLALELDGVQPDSRLEVGTAVDLIVSGGPTAKPMPSFVGLTVDQAIDQANELGLGLIREDTHSEQYDAGFIVHTEPPTDALVEPGDELTIVVSLGPPFVAVPDVTGLDPEAAAAELGAAGFAVAETVGPGDQPVLRTSPAAGESHRKGSAVVLHTAP